MVGDEESNSLKNRKNMIAEEVLDYRKIRTLHDKKCIDEVLKEGILML